MNARVLQFLPVIMVLMQVAVSTVGFGNSALGTGPGTGSATTSPPERDTAARGPPRDPRQHLGLAKSSSQADQETRVGSLSAVHVQQATRRPANMDDVSAEPGNPAPPPPPTAQLRQPPDDASRGSSLSAAPVEGVPSTAPPDEEEKSEKGRESKASVPDLQQAAEPVPQPPDARGSESDSRLHGTANAPVPETGNTFQSEARTLLPSTLAAAAVSSGTQHKVGHNLRQSAYAHTSPADGGGGGGGGGNDSSTGPPADRHGSSSTFVEVIAMAIIASVFLSFHTMEVFLVCLGVFVSSVLVLSTCLFLRKNRTVRQVYEVPGKEEKAGRPPPYDDLEHLPTAVELQRRAMPLPLPPSDPKSRPDDPLSPFYIDGGLQPCPTPTVYSDDATSTVNRTMTRVTNHLYHELERVPAGRPESDPPTSGYLECLGPAPPPPIDLNRLSALPPPSASMLDLTGD